MNPSVAPPNPVILLQTKLYPPKTGQQLIERSRLLDLLNRGIERKLTLITAPAGYGKTTLVSQWLASHVADAGQIADNSTELQSHRHHFATARVAWLSLDEYDDDLQLFVRYLVTAIQTAWPDSCTNTLTILQNPQQIPEAYLVNVLLNDLMALPEALILVLDDYQFVKEERIHEFLNRLLNHLPALVHLVLISRTEPPLALPQLRVRRQMNELRVADLCFSSTETEQYLTQTMGRTLAPGTLSVLQDKTEGWIAGLYLVTLSLGDNANESALVRHMQANNVNILDYLFAEVLMKLPGAVQEFLLRTAILNRFCSPLCEELLSAEWLEKMSDDDPLTHIIGTSPRPAQSIMTWLARHQLLLIGLDDTGEWYRYHHLFQRMLVQNLQKRISADEIAALHRQCSRWLAGKGLIDEAIHHALSGDEPLFAAQLIEEQRLALLAQFDFATLERWLALLPESTIAQHPSLLLLKCWIAVSLHRFTFAAVLPLLQQAEACFEPPNRPLDAGAQAILQAEITAVRGAVSFIHHDLEEAVQYLRQALELLPDSHVFMRALVILYISTSARLMGQEGIMNTLIHKEIQNSAGQFSLAKLWLQTYLPVHDYLAGNLQQTVQSAQFIIHQIEAQSNDNRFLLSVPYRWLGYIYYEWNDLPTAINYLRQVNQSNSIPYFNSQLNLAWIYEVTGEPDKAQQIVDELTRWATALASHTFDNELASFQARRLYRQQNIDLALRTLRAVEIAVSIQGLLATTEIPALTLTKVLLAHDNEDHWREAKELLTNLWVLVEKVGNVSGQIEILALIALLHQRYEQHDEALAALKRSLLAAQPGGFIRTFVDLGSPMADLLYQLLGKGVEADYLGRILAAFPQTTPNDALSLHVQQTAQAHLIEPLTERESEILLFLQQGRSNKAIACDLGISNLTVKRHTINLYQKLSVHSRKQAVARAKALGILPTKQE